MATTTAGGQLSRFAHLTGGIAAKAKSKAEDDEDKKKDADTGDDQDESAVEDDDTGDDDQRKTDDEADDDGEDGDEKKKDGKKGKAKARSSPVSKAAYDAGYAAGFEAAQKRGAAILGHASAAANPALAAQMATCNSLPARDAIGIMKAAAVAPLRHSAGLSARMETVTPINVGSGGGAEASTDPRAVAKERAAAILANARKGGAKY